MKRCTKCGETKPLGEFYRNRRRKDGRHCWCAECSRKQNRVNYWAYERARRPAYRKKHRQRLRLYDREYRRQPYAIVAQEESRQRRIASDPDRERGIWRANAHRRSARKAKLPATLTGVQRQQTMAVFAGRCAYCEKKATTLHQDHVLALSRGGGYIMGNLVPACPDCNFSKRAKPYREWMQSKGYDTSLFEHKLANLEWLASEPT